MGLFLDSLFFSTDLYVCPHNLRGLHYCSYTESLDISTEQRILGWQFFSQYFKDIVLLCSGFHNFWQGIDCHFYLYSSVYNVSLQSGDFQNFLFITVLKQFDNDRVFLIFFAFGVSHFWASRIHKFISHETWQSLSHYLFLHTFPSACPSSRFLQKSHYMCIRLLYVVPNSQLNFFFSPFCFILLCFVSFLLPYLQVTNHLFDSIYCATNLIHCIFFLISGNTVFTKFHFGHVYIFHVSS